jgi:hypothetical protein
MANTPTPASPAYSDYVATIQTWLATTAGCMVDFPELRDWCIPDDFLDEDGNAATLNYDNIYGYFDETTVNDAYQTEYATVNGSSGTTGTFTNKPVAYLQTESDGIDTLAKMYVYRYQPRLKNYRDDCEQKAIRTYSSLSISLAKLQLLETSV